MEGEKKICVYPDGIGYVSLLDSMGDEWTPAEDARTSTGKGRLGPEKDARLQERLSRDNHTSPFEGVVVKFELCVPLFVLREMDRHRTLDKESDGDIAEVVTPEEASRKWLCRNEMSGRYIQMPDIYYHPGVVRGQSRTNNQGGSDGATDVPPEVQEEFIRQGTELTRRARGVYDWAIEHGIEKGLARIYNTQNQYTKIRLTGSLKNWCDFLKLRLPSAVLWEARVVAEAVESILTELFPSVMEQWRRNAYDTVTLRRDEAMNIIDVIAGGDDIDPALFEKLERLVNRG